MRSGGRNFLTGVQGEASVKGLFVPQKLKQFADIALITDFDCKNDQNLKILHNSPPDS